MKDGERVVELLTQCGRLMMHGSFTKYDLDFIKIGLEKLLSATNKTIAKHNQPVERDG